MWERKRGRGQGEAHGDGSTVACTRCQMHGAEKQASLVWVWFEQPHDGGRHTHTLPARDLHLLPAHTHPDLMRAGDLCCACLSTRTMTPCIVPCSLCER
jgi:hypothetical protein